MAEIARVQEATKALPANDFKRFGELMNASHDSLNLDFEVSCDELNELVEIARATPGVLGSRMSGGGFGGCMVTLVSADQADTLIEAFKTKYGGYQEGAAFKSAPSAGAGAFTFASPPAMSAVASQE